MGKILTPALTAAAAALLLAACNTAGCIDNQSSIPLACFYSMATGKKVAVDSLAVWGVGAPGDSLLLSARQSASELYLPFRSTAPSTSFCFAYRSRQLDRPELQDTIRVEYTSTPRFISEECGVGFRYRITRLSHTCHLIDSVGIADSLVTNISSETLEIYFRTAGHEEGGEE